MLNSPKPWSISGSQLYTQKSPQKSTASTMLDMKKQFVSAGIEKIYPKKAIGTERA